MPRRLAWTTLALGTLLLAWAGSPAQASQETAEAEGRDCAVCHVDSQGDRLTDRGMYFELLGSLEGFEEVAERFGSCTYCHVARPGSGELSREGYRFRWMMEDMAGLRAWLAENHPRRADHPDDDGQRGAAAADEREAEAEEPSSVGNDG